LAAVLLVLAVLAVWLNGPGLRWFGPRIAQHYLEKAGLDGRFEVEGNLIGGLSVGGFQLTSDGPLERLTVDRITPHYRFGGLLRGKVDGVTVDGVHVGLRFDPRDDDREDEGPPDLEAVVATLREVRRHAVAHGVTITDLTLAATVNGEPIASLAPSRLTHRAGSGVYQIDLGVVTDATGREWNAQSSAIVWAGDRITLDQLDPLAGIGVRELVLMLPASGGPSASARLLLDEGVLEVASGAGFESLALDLRSGSVDPAVVLAPFGIEVPVAGVLDSLTLRADGLLPDIRMATGTAAAGFREVAWEDWQAERVGIEAVLGGETASVTLRSEAFDSEMSLAAQVAVERLADRLALGEGGGTFLVPAVPRVVAALAPRIEAIDPSASVPESSLAGEFTVAFAGIRPTSAMVRAALTPAAADDASPIGLMLAWRDDQPLVAEATLDGVTASGRYDLATTEYVATVLLEEFTSARVEPWLVAGSVTLPGGAHVSGRWDGSGNFTTGDHTGDAALADARWAQAEVLAAGGRGGIRYSPGRIHLDALELVIDDQTVVLEAELADGILEVSRFDWTVDGSEIASGSATLPAPAEWTSADAWRETLASDERPIGLTVETAELSLGLLERWLPGVDRLDPESTGQLELAVSGTYADPVVLAALELRQLRAPDQPDLPPADVSLGINAADGRVLVEGTITAPDFAPAQVTATMPFRPADWAAEPGQLMDEPLDARLSLPRLELARFATLVPAARTLSGVVTGDVTVSGPLRDLEASGSLALQDGGIALITDAFPDVTGMTGTLDITPDTATLTNLRATIAGGTLTGGGTVGLDGMTPAEMDVSLTADHIPILRNELVIIRANAALRVQGTPEAAAISGTVGLVDSLFFRDIEILPIGSPIAGPAAAELPRIDAPRDLSAFVPERFRDWGLNVVVRTDDPFLIRGNLGTGRIDASIRIGGTLGVPAPNGTAVISNATAALPFSTLRVRTGTLRFTPENGFDPTLEIRAQAEPRPYRVDIFVYGLLSNPQLILTSSPPLPENEIMTLLATGTTTEGLEDPQMAATRALQLLLEELRRGRTRIGRQLRPLLQVLDRVDFTLAEQDPYDSDAYTTATISLSDRWFLSAGVGGQEGDTRLLAIWRFTFR